MKQPIEAKVLLFISLLSEYMNILYKQIHFLKIF